jgi:hypothetical protein
MGSERRISNRRKFGYFMPVLDNTTNEKIGYLADISSQGFKLENRKRLAVNSVYQLRLELTREISNKPFIVFFAKVAWSEPDPYNPLEYVHGFQIVNISLDEQGVIDRLVAKYGVA